MAIKGFTLLELLFIMAIIAIISIVALPKQSSISLGLDIQASRLLNDIRYTQALSMATGERYYWKKNSETTYQIINESGIPQFMPEGNNTAQLMNGIVISALSNLPNNILAFSSLGVPYIASGLTASALTSTAIIELSSGVRSKQIAIVAETGYTELL